MKYFYIGLYWIAFLILLSLFGEYVISRPVNGFLQLLCLVGLSGSLIYLIYRTKKLINKKENV